MLEYFGISRSTYYARLASIKKGDKYAEEREAIRTLVAMNKGRYGYRRITIALHKLGIHINHKVVMRIMKEENLTCKVRLKKYRSYRGSEGKIAPNMIKRNFTATKPDQKWTTDITEFHLFGRKVYLSPILDMYNGEIVSYEISERPVLTQVLSMLDKAFKNRPNSKGCILHSDQGWQYQHSTYQETLKNHAIIQSISRKENCLDNSVMENFFGLLKSELLYLEKFASYEDFISKLKDYIDYYNTKRIKLLFGNESGRIPNSFPKSSLIISVQENGCRSYLVRVHRFYFLSPLMNGIHIIIQYNRPRNSVYFYITGYFIFSENKHFIHNVIR